MTIGILQPGYLPWLGFFDQMARVDLFVFLDNVQYNTSWRNRNRIRTAQGWQYLTVPVPKKGRIKQKIKDVKIAEQKEWPKRHLSLVRENYRRAPFFEEIYSMLEQTLMKPWTFLLDLDLALIEELRSWLGVDTHTKMASSIIPELQKGTAGLIDLCMAVGADAFLEGEVGKNYIDVSLCQQNGIEVIFHHYAHPVYPQQFEPFISHLSCVDALFNCGQKAKNFLHR